MKQLLFAGAALAALASGAQAQTSDPLLGFCQAATTCNPFSNAGSNTIEVTTSGGADPNFGFDVSNGGGSLTGHYLLEVLVPTNIVGAGAEVLEIHMTSGGVTDTTTADVFGVQRVGVWNSGTLNNFLGFGASNPANPIGNYVGTGSGGADAGDPTASAFFVYQVDLGQDKVSPQSAGNTGVPDFTFDLGTGLNAPPVGSYVVGFLLGTPQFGDIATANSESLLIDSQIGTLFSVVPEPASLALFGVGLFGLGLALRRRRSS